MIVVAVATALTLVPALLVLAGRRLIRPSILARVPGLRGILARTSDVQTEEGVFSRLAGRVQRHPWFVLVASLVVLGILALPLAHLELRNSTTELLPAGQHPARVRRHARPRLPGRVHAPPITVVAQTSLEEATAWAATLEDLDGVASVDPPTPIDSYVVIGVRPDTDDPGDAVARGVVEEHPRPRRAVPDVGDRPGRLADRLHRRGRRRAHRGRSAIVALATLVLLFLMTGSVVVPVKALLTNALSLAASLGVLVWVFQDGHLSGLLNFTPTGGIETYVIALVIAFAFGLAMDYEVFLLSRIKELRRRRASPTTRPSGSACSARAGSSRPRRSSSSSCSPASWRASCW